MKHFLKASIVTAAVMGTALIAGSASAGIADTKHNLGTSAAAANNQTGGTGEICVFCHTPHGTDISTDSSPPLWNKDITAATFTTYDQLGTSTLDGGVAAGNSLGGVSLACLTCHDGTQAMDNILNAPGSGGYDLTGGGVNGRTGGGWDWTSPGNANLSAEGAFLPGVDGGGSPTNIWNIGTDLRNDHPVSVQYAGGGYSAGNAAGPGRDGDF